jgi:hypothetical protein
MRASANLVFVNSSKQTTCGKCDGLGIIRAFAHLDNGRCYACQGAGTLELSAAPMSAARKADLDGEIMSYIEFANTDNSTAYELAHRLLRLRDSGAARSYLDAMTPAQRRVVVAKGFEIRNQAAE